ncbi:hypothetical protein VOLCADRAFT_94781 [Volvox carteri f. nagariensis]|uniref:Uncharacterized protein n=1 Tax=Volvox carteri f. nagariensis TaxID=3068 RepID=D8U5R1_VOLCA|nr:uncharacterized protein VOLCADRAFT_94781 [Volvox carteri f. nagariensis]EFJ44965.1 hypothetical protein VOLCADRAFT_94781 [Volvox carteri f. nagariensis]|eukprot:XP_002953936.1 hypothetical protein VOLCADRAFT_94781 [Volvox carteri f. nagariensis]
MDSQDIFEEVASQTGAALAALTIDDCTRPKNGASLVAWTLQDWQPCGIETHVLLSSFPGTCDGNPAAEPVGTDATERELERVLTRFEEDSLQHRERIVCVVRINNRTLRELYDSRRGEMKNCGAQQQEERYLWCPVAKAELANIATKGFKSLERKPLYMANAAWALEKAEDMERRGEPVVQPFVAEAKPAAVEASAPTVVEAPASTATSAITVVPSTMDSRSGAASSISAQEPTSSRFKLPSFRVPSLFSALPSLFSPGRHKREDTPMPSASAWPRGLPGTEATGKGCALLLCRVAPGTMQLGRIGGEVSKAHSIMDMELVRESSEKRRAAAAAAGRFVPHIIREAAEDPAWEAKGMYASDLVMELQCAAAQAYPEYIVHFA